MNIKKVFIVKSLVIIFFVALFCGLLYENSKMLDTIDSYELKEKIAKEEMPFIDLDTSSQLSANFESFTFFKEGINISIVGDELVNILSDKEILILNGLKFRRTKENE
jgi:hypothetical protein